MTSAQDNNFFAAGFVSRTDEDEGTWIEILKADKEPSGLEICVAGPNSRRRQEFARKITNKRMNRKTQMTSEQVEKAILQELVVATIDWKFPEAFPNAPECTADEVEKIYDEYPDILRQVMEESGETANFTKPSAKN